MKPLTIFLRLQNCSAKSVKVQQSYRSVVESRVHTLSRQQLCTTVLLTCPEVWAERHRPVILWEETHQGFPVSSRGGRRTSLSLKVNYYLIHLIKDKNTSPYQRNHDNGLFGAFWGVFWWTCFTLTRGWKGHGSCDTPDCWLKKLILL